MKKLMIVILSVVTMFSVWICYPSQVIGKSTVETMTVHKKGTCGKNVSWCLYNDGTFVVSGQGDMYDYEYNID